MQNDLATETAIASADLAQIAQSVFETMLNLPVFECTAPWFPSRERLIASVHLTGDWTGAVIVECSNGLACRLAGRYLSTDPPAAVDDVVRDVLGELANMLGGNLKCVLTHGIRISMPSVVDGSDCGLRVCSAVVREQRAFDSAEGVFWVTLLHGVER
jgi:chemotaxis protein CheX